MSIVQSYKIFLKITTHTHLNAVSMRSSQMFCGKSLAPRVVGIDEPNNTSIPNTTGIA